MHYDYGAVGALGCYFFAPRDSLCPMSQYYFSLNLNSSWTDSTVTGPSSLHKFKQHLIMMGGVLYAFRRHFLRGGISDQFKTRALAISLGTLSSLRSGF